MIIDPIERRLCELDEENVSFSEAFSKRVFAKSPLVMCAAGLASGIILHNYTGVSSTFWLYVMGIALVISCIAGFFLKADKKVWCIGLTAFVFFICVGGVRLDDFYKPKQNDIRNFVSGERTPAVIKGMVISRLRFEDRDRWVFGRYVWGDPSSSFYLKLSDAKFKSGWSNTSGTVRVQASGKVNGIGPGDIVEVYCWLDKFEGPTNPGEFDVAKYLKGRGVYVSASVKSAGGIKQIVDENERSKIYSALIKARERVKLIAEGSLLGEGYWEESDQGLAAALLLGHRGKIDSNTYEAFVRTGLAHFISLSGLHMGMLAGIIWWICKTAGLTKRWRAFVTIVLIGVYVLALPPRAPTMRAAIMCWFFCLSVLVRRKSNSLNALSLSAIVLLLVRPTDVFNAGWQLSFATVLGIILLQERIWQRLIDASYFRFKFLQSLPHENYYGYIAGKTVTYLLAMVSVGLAAWIGGAGVLLYHFGVLTPTSCLWTAVVFPIVAVILAAGFFQIILSLLLPTLAIGLGIIVESMSNVLSWIVIWIAKIDNTQIAIGKVGAGLIVMYYAGLFILRFERIRKPCIKKFAVAAAIGLMLVPSAISSIRKDADQSLEITYLDVGHGQAVVISTPRGKNILIDAGSLTRKNCGNRIVLPFLKEKGIGKLDAIIISHDDIDHLNGIPEIVAGIPVGGVYVNSGFMKNAQKRSSGGYLRQWLEKHGHKLKNLNNGLNKAKGVKITPIWPSEEICDQPNISDNDKSQVLLMEYAGRKVLICSDIEIMAQQKILADNPGLDVDIIAMPHHASNANLVEGFFDQLRAEILIGSCSTGRYKSTYKHPDIKSYYTAIDGAITITIKKNANISVKGFDAAAGI